MAAFSASNLVAAQLLIKEEFTKPEMREQVLPSLKMGLANQGVFFEDPEAARKREDRTVYAYYMKRRKTAVGAARSATHTGSREDSAQVTLTWITYTRTFSTSLKQFDTNVFTYDNGFVQGLKNAVLDIHAAIEADTIANLLTYKNQVVQTTTPVGTRVNWNATNYAHEIAAGDVKQFFQLSKIVMAANYYNDAAFDVIASGPVMANSQFYASQGTGNYQNTAFQYAGMNPMYSPNLADSNYSNGIALVMPQGSFSLLPWIPKQNRIGHGDMNSYVGGYSNMADPLGTSLQFAIHGYTYRTDTSGSNGIAQDDQLELEVSVDVGFVASPISVSNEYPIYEFAQM